MPCINNRQGCALPKPNSDQYLLFYQQTLHLKAKKRPRTAANASIKSLLTQYNQQQMGQKEEHAPSSVGYKRRGACIWCTMEFQEKKRSGETVNWNNEVKRTARMCAYCNQNSIENKSCFLCSEHFNTFHEYD